MLLGPITNSPIRDNRIIVHYRAGILDSLSRMIFLVQLGFSDPYVFKGIALFYEEFAEMKSSLQGPTGLLDSFFKPFFFIFQESRRFSSLVLFQNSVC